MTAEKTLLGYRINDLQACNVEILCSGTLYHGIHNSILTKTTVDAGYIFWKRDTSDNQEWYDFKPHSNAKRPYYRRTRRKPS